MKFACLLAPLLLLAAGAFFACAPSASWSENSPNSPNFPTSPAPSFSSPAPNITLALIPEGQYGRHRVRKMNPRYITIHSTQSYSRGADARAHARMLQRGALKGTKNSLGYLTWHYSVDENSIYQSLPDNEQGQHADYEGPGNRYSIGIEMCENADGSFPATLDRTARLTAYLMKKHGIPLKNVVGHNNWRQIRYSDNRDLGHKACPKPLLDGNQYGAKWNGFLNQVKSHL